MAKAKDDKANASALLREQVEQNSGPEDGTVVRFSYTFDRNDYDDAKKRRKKNFAYTYLAVWVEAASLWYLTGNVEALSRTMSHSDFLKLLTTANTLSAEVAAGWDTFKP